MYYLTNWKSEINVLAPFQGLSGRICSVLLSSGLPKDPPKESRECPHEGNCNQSYGGQGGSGDWSPGFPGLPSL